MAKTEKNQNDARVIKTRAKLFGAFSKLLATKPFEEIAVYEICDEAGVRRATFYQHFADKHDFLALMVSSFLDDFDGQTKKDNERIYGATHHINFVRELMHYLCDNENAVMLIIKSNMAATLVDIIIGEIYKESRAWLEGDVKNGKELVASVDAVAMMLSGGIASIIVKWFSDDKPTSVSEVLYDVEGLILAMFKK